jgi:hypothetical protein
VRESGADARDVKGTRELTREGGVSEGTRTLTP